MASLLPWLRVLLAIVAYVGIALLTTRLMRWLDLDLREMSSRTSARVMLLGVAANLVVVGIVLAMLALLDHRSIGALGLSATAQDAAAMAGGTVLVAGVSIGFLTVLALTGRASVERRRSGISLENALSALGMLLVLLAVAAAEEVLFRGYITLELLDSGPWTVAITSTVLFTAIHTLTNRVTVAQTASWALGGGMLLAAYLLSGSLWVAIALHLVLDVTNVVALGIVDRHSLVTLTPPPSDGDRAWYRLATTVALVILLVGLYGPTIKVG